MSSHLNGVARNHVEAYNVTWGETKFDQKITRYNDVKNNFSKNGRPIYRVGHNISDGFKLSNTTLGWHWATQYGKGLNPEHIASALSGNTVIGVPSLDRAITMRLGAGIRRFVYCYPYSNDRYIYGGYCVTQNYVNSIEIDATKLPQSRSLRLSNGSAVLPSDVLGMIQSAVQPTSCVVEQLYGTVNKSVQPFTQAIPGAVVTIAGWYEMHFSIRNPANGDLAYWGVIYSVNEENTSGYKLIRTQSDAHLLLDPTDPNLLNSSALVKHSSIQTMQVFPFCTGCSNVDENTIYDPLSQLSNPLANQTGFDNYDNIEYTFADLFKLKADLAICVNIGTGYPEELEGLLEYVYESGVPLAFIELGSELMGTWNMNSQNCANPNDLATATMPFILRVRNSTIKKVPSTKIATTSTYSYLLEFNQNSAPVPPFTSIGMNIINWMTPYLSGGKSLVDYVNIHTYPYYLVKHQAFSKEKAIALLAQCQYFDKKVLPEVHDALVSLGIGDQVDIVLTEGNTAWCDDSACDVKETTPQHRTMTEAMFFADNFVTAARHKAKAFIPFALIKQGIYNTKGVDYSIFNNDPTDPESWFILGEDPQQNIHFDPNNDNFVDHSNKNEIFYRPVFKAKKMIFENLGDQLVEKNKYSVNGATEVQANYYGEAPGKIDAISVLPTLRISKTDNEAYILIVNRNPDENEYVSLQIDGVPISVGQIMFMQGSVNSKQPFYTDKNGNVIIPSVPGPNYDPVSFNNNQADFQDIQAIDGRFEIRKFSISILKVALGVRPTITCTSPPVLNSSCSSIGVVQLPQNQIPLPHVLDSYGLYYYENLDVQGVAEPTQFDPSDPKWIHFGNLPASATNGSITGLKFPQDVYQVAVVVRYKIQLSQFVGPVLDSIDCFAEISTTSCESSKCILDLNLNPGYKNVSQGTVSEAIAQLTLESALDSETKPQKLIITSPHLLIDQNYTFFESEIWCFPNTAISVGQDVSFTVKTSVLAGCDLMWNGISVTQPGSIVTLEQSTIKDAKIGLHYALVMSTSTSSKSPVFLLNDASFIRNHTGISIQNNATGANVYLKANSVFKAVYVEGTEYNLKPVFNDNQKMRAQVGISLQHVRTPLLFGKNNSFAGGVTINNVMQPIDVLDNSKQLVFRSLNIDNSTMSGSTGNLVQVLNSSSGLSIINNTTRHWLIGNNQNRGAIFSFNGPLYITGVKASGVKYGIDAITDNYIYALGNELKVSATGISAFSKGVVIESNQISFTNKPFSIGDQGGSIFGNNYGSQGIQVVTAQGYKFPDFLNLISDNNISVVAKHPTQYNAPPQTIAAGINIWNGSRLKIANNTVGLQNDYPFADQPRFYGIYKSNATGSVICSNDIMGLSGFDRGIGAFMSNGPITCNKVTNTKESLYMEGDNELGNAITSNEFSTTQHGVYVNNSGSISAILGDQVRQENTWPNNWLEGGYWNGDPTFIQFSEFINHPSFPYFPLAVFPATDWFKPNSVSGPDPICLLPGFSNLSNCPSPPVVTPPPGGGVGRELRTLASKANTLQEPYRTMIVRRELERIEGLYPELIGAPTALKDFVEVYQDSPIDQLVEVDALMANPLADMPDLIQTQSALQQEMQNALPAVYQHYDWLYELTTSEMQQYIASGQTDPILTNFEQINLNLATVNEQVRDITAQKIAVAHGLNASISEVNQYIALEKAVNVLLFKSVEANTPQPFTAQEWDFIGEIARLCPQDFGDGVIKARSLWLKHGGGFETAWQDCFPEYESTTPPSMGKQILPAQETGGAKLLVEVPMVYPVPASESCTILTPDTYLGSRYQVISGAGVLVQEGMIIDKQTQLSTSSWSHGIYIVKIQHQAYRPVTLKLIVQKI
jgi:hypothetical protein